VDLDEPEAVEMLRVNAKAALSSPGQARRAQHAKHHGCVTATFEVRGDMAIDIREGLFAAPGQYPAYIRSSNGRHRDDRRPDAHGMAIKLLGVPGEKLPPGGTHQTAQDFVLVDSEVFFTGDGAAYAWLSVRRRPQERRQRRSDRIAAGLADRAK
jgi:catalase